MENFFDEYGFVLISVLCGTFLSAAIIAGLNIDGFMGNAIIRFAESIIGG